MINTGLNLHVLFNTEIGLFLYSSHLTRPCVVTTDVGRLTEPYPFA